jgi:MSHA pilin protein MshD
MRSLRQTGLTLIELVISIIIISISVVGILSVMNQTTAHSADPMLQHQATAIAEAYMEEILAKSFIAQPGTGSRANFDDVNDYDGLADAGAEDQFGTAIGGLGSYNVSVVVTPETLVTQSVKRVDITVTNGTIVNLTLSGYRASY